VKTLPRQYATTVSVTTNTFWAINWSPPFSITSEARRTSPPFGVMPQPGAHSSDTLEFFAASPKLSERPASRDATHLKYNVTVLNWAVVLPTGNSDTGSLPLQD